LNKGGREKRVPPLKQHVEIITTFANMMGDIAPRTQELSKLQTGKPKETSVQGVKNKLLKTTGH
jgi:hypothetical protein